MRIDIVLLALLFCGAFFWLGKSGRWKWAVVISLGPIVATALSLQQIAGFPDAPTGIEAFIIGVTFAILFLAWMSYLAGNKTVKARTIDLEK